MSNRDYSELSRVINNDFLTMVDEHPESFDCLFYPATEVTENPVPQGYEDVVGALDTTERKIDYGSPVQSRAMIVPDEAITGSLIAFGSGTDVDTFSGTEPIVILIKEPVVPQQSVISWSERISIDDDSERVLSYYVIESKPFGRAPVAGMKHYCIPLYSDGEQE